MTPIRFVSRRVCSILPLADPKWADPIKNVLRNRAQARAVAQVVAALKPTHSQLFAIARAEADLNPGAPFQPPALRVVNGMSTTTNTTISSMSPRTPGTAHIEGLPSPRGAGWPNGGLNDVFFQAPTPTGLPTHPEDPVESQQTLLASPGTQVISLNYSESAETATETPPPPPPPKPINPSIHTLEKAASARIYFENIYFPLLRQPPSREQRRVAMEQEMDQMGLPEDRKRHLRDRWKKNETEYLREKRKKVDPSAFRILKTIGHGKQITSSVGHAFHVKK